MERAKIESSEVVLDLGRVSVETRGGPATMPELSQEHVVSGLSED